MSPKSKTKKPEPEEKTEAVAVAEPRKPMPMQLTTGGALLPTSLAEAMEVAKLIAYSGMVPKDYIERPGAVMVAIQMGAEIGLSPMAAVQNIAVINGRPSIWGDAMLALALAHPDVEDVIEMDFDEITEKGSASCTVVLRNREDITRTFTMADAEKAKLLGKDTPWKTYPSRMLQMRARGFALRDSVPGAFRGIHSVEEARDMPPVVLVETTLQPVPEEAVTQAKTSKTKDELEKRRAAKAKKPTPSLTDQEANALDDAELKRRTEAKTASPAPQQQQTIDGKYENVGPAPMTDEEVADVGGDDEAGF